MLQTNVFSICPAIGRVPQSLSIIIDALVVFSEVWPKRKASTQHMWLLTRPFLAKSLAALIFYTYVLLTSSLSLSLLAQKPGKMSSLSLSR